MRHPEQQEAVSYLMDAFNAPEFTDAQDEVNRSWQSIAYYMVEYAKKQNKELIDALNSIASENYDDDDKKRHLRATIDRMKEAASEAVVKAITL